MLFPCRVSIFALAFVAIGSTRIRLALLITSAFTDVVDGWLARRSHMVSRSGALIDAIADRVFVLAAVVALVADGMLSFGESLILLSRDIMTRHWLHSGADHPLVARGDVQGAANGKDRDHSPVRSTCRGAGQAGQQGNAPGCNSAGLSYRGCGLHLRVVAGPGEGRRSTVDSRLTTADPRWLSIDSTVWGADRSARRAL